LTVVAPVLVTVELARTANGAATPRLTGACALVTVKFVELEAPPTLFVKVIRPVVAPSGTTTASWVSEIPLKFVVAVALKETDLVPVKCVPVRVTVVPTTPLVGEKEVIVGAAVEFTVKIAELVPAPDGVTTLIFPGVAPAGTLVLIWVLETTVNVASVPLNDDVGSK
jgi:hypothetical protein